MYLKKLVNQSLVVFTLISPLTSIAIAKTGTVVTKMPLDPAHGLLEAKSQYRIEYTAVDGVRGKESVLTVRQCLFPLAQSQRAVGR